MTPGYDRSLYRRWPGTCLWKVMDGSSHSLLHKRHPCKFIYGVRSVFPMICCAAAWSHGGTSRGRQTVPSK